MEGAVGSRWARRLRIFRYEVHRWRDGVIPDLAEAVASPERLTSDPLLTLRIFDLVASGAAVDLGTRRGACRRDVELELGHCLADRARRHRCGLAAPARPGTGAGLAGRARHREPRVRQQRPVARASSDALATASEGATRRCRTLDRSPGAVRSGRPSADASRRARPYLLRRAGSRCRATRSRGSPRPDRRPRHHAGATRARTPAGAPHRAASRRWRRQGTRAAARRRAAGSSPRSAR